MFFDIDCFAEREFVWRNYIAAKTLLPNQRIKLIDLKEFTALALDLTKKTFMVRVAALKVPKAADIMIYFPRAI